MKKIYILLCFIIFSCLMCLANDLVQPDYEIKLFLDNTKILDSDSMNLLISAKKYLGIENYYAMSMQFLDSSQKELYNQGWVVRIRHKSKEEEIEISYKYRIPVVTNIQDALLQAKQFGWDSSETGYDYQIDWGYEKQTLSITKSKNDETYNTLPNFEKAREIAYNYIPGKLEKWGKRYLGVEKWAMDILEQAHIYGNVQGIRYIGYFHLQNYGQIKIYLEVWDIAGTRITEISTKVADETNAKKIHTLLKEQLREKNLLLEEDILKTKMILSAY